MADKLMWHGKLTSVQPRIRLWGSFDQRSHTYLGYALFIEGISGDEAKTFRIGIGKAAQARHQFRAGDEVQGESLPVVDARKEPIITRPPG